MKRLIRPLLAGAGVAGGLAAANRALRNAPLPVNALGGTRRPWSWRGHELFVTEAGEGRPVLLVHGVYAGASSYEFRRLFPLLAAHGRVAAFDFLGCGLSDKPRARYAPELFVDQIADALERFGGEPATVVASSLGAAYAILAAARDGGRIGRLVTICPTGLAGTLDRPPPSRRSPVSRLVAAPLVGETLYNALASRAAIGWFLQREVYADPARVTPEVVDHYYAVSHQPGSRRVVAAFVGGLLDCDVARELPFLELPLLVVWGEKASRTNPRSNADEFLRLAKHARLATFAESGLLPHEEEPQAVAAAIDGFIASSSHLQPDGP